MEFTGFTPETMDFLWGIRFNNNREWFAEHKTQYQQTLYEPMKALAKALAPSFADAPGLELHLSRIYRDMRMHPDTFYKDSLWFCFQRRTKGGILEHPNLCFELRPEGYRYGFLLYATRAIQMQELRGRMAEQPDRFLKMVKKAEKISGIVLDGDRYAKPKPCPDERLLPYFTMKNLMAIEDRPPDDILFSADLVDMLRNALTAWLPVLEFLEV
ncbi:MAG: DUF2461 domain-containing protein [Oscillospiraceae bacterium]|nr:DUF2461 domain-containing protein [Oscillospiraceae bacterium]